MSVKGGIAAHLKADPDVAAIVADRVEIAPMSQGVPLPFVVFSRDQTDHTRSLSGPSGLRESSFAINAYSRDTAEVEALAEAIRLSLDGWRGEMNGVHVTSVVLDDTSDVELADSEGGEDAILLIGLDFTVWHVESVPD